MKVLVCGGRDFVSYEYLKTVLSAIQVTHEPFTEIIHGAARGADELAGIYAQRHQIPCKAFPADWRTHGKAAGPIRNKQMLDEGRPDMVVAFKGGRGTANMVQQAKAAKVAVFDAST